MSRATPQTRWLEVRRDRPCPVCGKSDWCAWTPDGSMLRCMRGGNTPAGMRLLKNDLGGGTLYAWDKSGQEARRTRRQLTKESTPVESPRFDLDSFLEKARDRLTQDRLSSLAKATDVSSDAWAKLGPGWCEQADLRALHASGSGWKEDYPTGAWCIPECDGSGRLVGLTLRAVDGRKGAPSRKATGARRGLVIPNNLHELPDPVLCVEGASDVAACVALGGAAVGRPSNRAGVAELAELLEGRSILVVGERDGKPGGAWPGRDGATAVAQQLASRWGEKVAWTLPPADAKDVRVWLKTNPTGQAEDLLEALQQAVREVEPAKRTISDALVDLAVEKYRLGVSEAGEAFLVDRDVPGVAIWFRGGASALRVRLAKAYRAAYGKTPNASALADALVVLEGTALDAQGEAVALRLGEHKGGIVLDLGDASGRAVTVTPDGWSVVETPAVLFRRTALTGPLPEPADMHDPDVLLELRKFLNVGDEAWPLVIGWLVAACIPNIPHPVLMLGGEQGTGKSTAARLIVGLIDPSPALLRSEPRDPEAWAMAAAGSWCVTIDNISRIPGWWSDAICKAVTGDGWVRRKLYTDSELAVLSFRRCVVLTSIDAGNLRGDLGDRLLLVDLDRIGEGQRRTEAELEGVYAEARPRLLAGLLSAVSRTLAVLPEVELDTLPRMADFARVLAAVDRSCPELTGGRALELFIDQRDRIAADVIDSDAVATAMVSHVDNHGGRWRGTAKDLHEAITPDKPPKGWPANPRTMVARLKRITPALRQAGVEVTKPEVRTRRGQQYVIEKVCERPSQPSPGGVSGLAANVAGDGVQGKRSTTITPTVTQKSSIAPPAAATSDGCDGGDGSPQQHSIDVGAASRRRVRL